MSDPRRPAVDKPVKLTPAQRKLLGEIAPSGSPVAAHYEPAKKLAELGLAEWRSARYGEHLILTPAGRAALKETPNG